MRCLDAMMQKEISLLIFVKSENKTLGKYEPRIWSSNYRPFDEYGGECIDDWV
jgi:hypothetical protein